MQYIYILLCDAVLHMVDISSRITGFMVAYNIYAHVSSLQALRIWIIEYTHSVTQLADNNYPDAGQFYYEVRLHFIKIA